MSGTPEWPNAFDIAHIATAEGQMQLATALVRRASQLFWQREFIRPDDPEPFGPGSAADAVVSEAIGIDINPFDLVAVLGKNARTTEIHPESNYSAPADEVSEHLFGENHNYYETAQNFAAALLENELVNDETIVQEWRRRFNVYLNS